MSCTVYPVVNTQLKCADYCVKINGEEIALNTARVSAIPYNRRWPGHQRQLDQTEVIQFLSLATDEPLSFEIIPSTPFSNVRIRPQSLGIVPRIENGVIKFTLDKPAYFTVEPHGRNHALHIFADPPSSYSTSVCDPDVIYFGAGEHDVGMIEMKSNQTLFIDEGAVVYACIRAVDAKNIRIVGRGILDNSKNKETILYETSEDNNTTAVNNAIRLHTIQLEYCTGVEIDGITIRDSLVYNIRPVGCENLRIKNVKIIGCWRYNSDGIDMHNCVNVHVSDCFIRTFDDSICIKGFDFYYDGDVEAAVHAAMYRGGKAYDVFKNAVIENCVIWNDWGKCLEIGAETRAEEICNITFQNCDLIHLTGPALDCMNVDYADAHHITFTDISIEADETVPMPLIQKNDSEVYCNTDPDYMPNMLSASVVFHHEYSAKGKRRGRNRDILFKNIKLYSHKPPKMKFSGYDDEHRTENVLISNFCFNDKILTEPSDIVWELGEFTQNIRLVSDPYAQLSKNTVPSQKQLSSPNIIKFDFPDHTGARVMFVGNSITLHGIRPQIGWYNEWGMAASARDKDYIHLLETSIRQLAPDATFCVCQVAEWESRYKEGSSILSQFDQARNFRADLIIIRFVENVPRDDYESDVFLRELDALVNHLDATGKARFIITTGFWKHPGDDAIRTYAGRKNIPCVELGDLGEDEEMKAIGLFEHEGVANHPGDKGMRAICDRIMEAITKENTDLSLF